MKKVAVQCRNLSLSYGSAAVLRNVSLDIEPGEFFALLGPSGSGKSTLLRLIAGFAQPTSGVIRIDGTEISNTPPWQRDVGMVFQNYALWPHLSVWDNVAFGLVERRLDSAHIRSKVGAILEQVALSGYADRRPGQLSGGQQQRVALARTLVTEPKVLLLDEPLSNLDKALRLQLREELCAMQRRLGLTTLLVTHDQEDAMTSADRIGVLHDGVVQQVGSPTTLYDYPVNTFVARFVGTMNLLDARVLGRSTEMLRLELAGIGEWQLPTPGEVPGGERIRISFRPHAVRLKVADAATDARFAWMQGVIAASEFLGEFTRYRVRVGQQLLIAEQPHQMGLSRFPVGGEVWLGIEPSQVRLFAD